VNKELYAVALNNALNEIRNVCPDVSCSFIFTKDNLVVAADEQAAEEIIEKTMHSFQTIEEKACDAIGGLNALLINGTKGKASISSVNDMYVAMAASEKADLVCLQSVTRVVVPTMLRLLEGIAPTPLKLAPSQQLIVDTLSGFFVGSSVEIDPQVLEQWSEILNVKKVEEVEIEAFGGKTTQCKAKEIGEEKLRGKGIIRIPEKTCKSLEVKKGELVKVKPIEG
jgi:predicted regulator of Ras-like GTPase activity (Roadblock/LC7/MglB family)